MRTIKLVVMILLLIIISACQVDNHSNSSLKKLEFMNLLGEMPENSSCLPSIIRTDEFPTYKRMLVQYKISGDTIEAYILFPKNIQGKVPGILAIHQDGAHRPYEFGKGEPAGVHGDTSLFYALELCQRGFVVICPDRFGFESRMLSKTKFKKDFASFPISLDYYNQKIDLTEDLYKGAKSSQFIIEGKTMLGITITELKYAVNILCGLEEVDKNRIGVIGHSAGGFLAGVMMYIDERIKVGCSSCGSFMMNDIYNENYLRPMNGFAGLLTIPGIKLWGDFDNVIEGIYPRYFLELSADIDRSKVFKKVMEKQLKDGDAKHVNAKFYNLGQHTFSKKMRNDAYQWLESHLMI